MTDPWSPDQPAPDRAMRTRLAAVFGDVLPEGTGDDRVDPGDLARSDPDSLDEGTALLRWYTENRPPHHDR